MLSKDLITAMRLSPKRHYKIAHEAGLHPSTLSKIINGIERVRPGDPRVIRLGKVSGIPEEKLFCNEIQKD